MHVSLTGKLGKQIAGVTMGGTLSVTLSDSLLNYGTRCCYPPQTEVRLSSSSRSSIVAM